MSSSPSTDSHSSPENEVFGISAVSRLTGISTHALRIWERRYGVVSPDRTESQRRQYHREDIHRLVLLKNLVDRGHSIRNIASLTDKQLEQRVEESASLQHAADSSLADSSQPCRIAFAGPIIRDPLREATDSTDALQLVGEFVSIEDLRETIQPGSVDLLILEQSSLFEENIATAQALVEELKARRAIVVYRFAQSDVIAPLDKDIRNVTALLAPVDSEELRLACLADMRFAPAAPFPLSPKSGAETSPIESVESDGDIPRRRFSDEQLARIARHSSVVRCECPQHLANLLAGLNAFESYSADCENRNEEDAKLHAYLHQATAQCRSDMETALQHLLEAENISLEG